MSIAISVHDDAAPPPVRELARFCYDEEHTKVWLELSNYASNLGMNGAAAIFVNPQSQKRKMAKAYVGAYLEGNSWRPITAPVAHRWRKRWLNFGDCFSDDDLKTFQKAIIREWEDFDPRNAAAWAKGLTFGVSMSPAGFVMKALKTGFDAVGLGMATYSGFRTRDFTVADAAAYLLKLTKKYDSGTFVGFERYLPFIEGDEDDAVAEDERHLRPILMPPPNQPYPEDHYPYYQELGGIHIPRIDVYGFRGESRSPAEIKATGGFTPNYARDEDYVAKFAGARQDVALNLLKFIDNQDYGGFVSFTKSYAVAKYFAMGGGVQNVAKFRAGYIYVCRLLGAFEVPRAGQPVPVDPVVKPFTPPTPRLHGKPIAGPLRPQFTVEQMTGDAPYDEQELSMPGMVDWDNVMGWRRINKRGDFRGGVYLRKTLDADPNAKTEILDMLSGGCQGNYTARMKNSTMKMIHPNKMK